MIFSQSKREEITIAGTRQPIELLLLKGKKNLTKAEIEERKKTEVKAPKDKVKPPTYLNTEGKREFKKIAAELLKIDIITNLDIDSLARFIQSRQMYLKVTEKMIDLDPLDPDYMILINHHDKLFKQCRSASSDLGLTITSRSKLVIPKKEEPEKTAIEKMFGGV